LDARKEKSDNLKKEKIGREIRSRPLISKSGAAKRKMRKALKKAH